MEKQDKHVDIRPVISAEVPLLLIMIGSWFDSYVPVGNVDAWKCTL